MTFSEFAKTLHPIIGAGTNRSAFTKTILEQMLNDEHKDLLEEYQPSAFKSFFNGTRSISKLAQKMLPYLDGEDFCDAINDCSDAALECLCDVFDDTIGECNILHISEALKDLFLQILHESAAEQINGQKNKAQQGFAPEEPEDESHKADISNECFQDDTEYKCKADNKTLVQFAKVIQNGSDSVYLENNGTINLNW